MSRKIFIALLMPLLIAILVFATVYVPRMSIVPQGEFLFSGSQQSCQQGTYQIAHQQLIFTPKQKKDIFCVNPVMPKLYRYNIQNDQVTQISYPQAQALLLDAQDSSSQGLKVVRVPSGYPDLLGRIILQNKREYYLVGHGYSKHLVVPKDIVTFNFIAWIRHDQ